MSVGHLGLAQLYRDPEPNDVMITVVGHEQRTLAEIRHNGTVTYDPADVDEAAEIFWSAVTQRGNELAGLRAEVESLREAVAAAGARDAAAQAVVAAAQMFADEPDDALRHDALVYELGKYDGLVRAHETTHETTTTATKENEHG